MLHSPQLTVRQRKTCGALEVMALFGARVDVRIGQAVTDVVTDSGPRLLVEVDSVGETSSFPSESLSSKDGFV